MDYSSKRDSSVVFHSGWVDVGSTYYLKDREERFSADMIIKIFNSEDTRESSLLQVVNFHSSCSSKLHLKDRFGASQVVEWTNEKQGRVLSFVDITFDVSLTLPEIIPIDFMTMVSFVSSISTSEYSAKGITDQILEISVAGESTPVATTNFTTTIDLTQNQTYEVYTMIDGLSINQGVQCQGYNIYQFSTGT